jgi:hypothetical protein
MFKLVAIKSIERIGRMRMIWTGFENGLENR